MSLHPEIFPETEVRKIARSELERIKLGRFNFEKAAREVGCTWFEEDGYTRFLLPDNCDEKAKIEIKELFNEESILTYNITRNELYSFLEITNYLSEFLGDKKAAA